MKRFKFSIAWMAMFALVFTSCSKEETGVASDDSETVQVTFGALLNGFNKQHKENKQAETECRDDAVPAYVVIGGSTTENAEIDEDDLFQVGLVNNNGSWETTYSEDLALPAGTYYLQHFAVYDSNDEVLWVAPREGGSFADEVDNALPLEVELVPGTKPYIDVDVLCYYAREEAAYGYVFFDFNIIEVENSYCVFINYCDDETGRDYPAYFNLDVWTDGYGGEDEVELSIDSNEITMAGDWPSASVLCVALPNLADDEVFYVRATVENHDDLAYTADADDYFQWTITQEDIDNQEMFTPEYEHVRINCDTDNGGGEDETCDIEVACELNMENELDENCYYTELAGANDQGFVRISSAEELELLADVGGLDGLVPLATVDASVTDNLITIDIDTPNPPFSDTDEITAFSIEVRPSVGEGDGLRMSTTCWESRCGNTNNGTAEESFSFEGFTYEYPFYVRVNTVNCFEVVEPS